MNNVIQTVVSHIWVVGASLLAACTNIDEHAYPYSQGWRIGRVLETGSANSPFHFASVDCRSRLRKLDSSQSRLAYVQISFEPTGKKYFNNTAGQRYALVSASPTLHLEPDDRVYVNIQTCLLAKP